NVSARMTYDPVGRLTRTDTVRDTTAATAPPGCYTTTSSSDPALPVRAVVCPTTTGYDSQDHPVDITHAPPASTLSVHDHHRRQRQPDHKPLHHPGPARPGLPPPRHRHQLQHLPPLRPGRRHRRRIRPRHQQRQHEHQHSPHRHHLRRRPPAGRHHPGTAS